MASEKESDDVMEEDDYDEEADSDFDVGNTRDQDISSSEDDDKETGVVQRARPSQAKQKEHTEPELDSGDEATIREREKERKKRRRKGDTVGDDSGNESEGWRAKTRAMRTKDQEETKRSRLATSKGSTIDVDKIWEEMNRTDRLPPVHMEVDRIDGQPVVVVAAAASTDHPGNGSDKENIPSQQTEELITIKRTFKFAGEVHTEEKTVAKSSAEAKLWLSQQDGKLQPLEEVSTAAQRPPRKISRFDPNYNNLTAFKTNWTRGNGANQAFKGPRLNVVEKSKMDWAAHVDAEGLKDELDVHAKAKEGYHSRMDFLSQVEQRKEEEARQARLGR